MNFRKSCVLCGSTSDIEEHHVGGRNFNFVLPLCRQHHAAITVGLRRLRIDTSIKAKQLAHAIRATAYFLWMLLDELSKEDYEDDGEA